MKKIVSLLVLIILMSNQLLATEQDPDILHYGKEKLTLDIGWGHPSPLETYFRQTNIQYPFTMLSTANYRGHIATWKIEEGKFYLVEVAIKKEKFKPEKFKIESNNKAFSTSDNVFADWFNGILVCQKRSKKNYWEIEYSVYIHVNNGVIQKTEQITDKDFKRIRNMTEKDTSDLELMNKYSILFLNQSYISYYFRLHDKEEITIKGKKGFIRGKNGNSIILEYFDNDHMKWVYNWENFETSGAPNGNWEIEENKLFLSSMNLHTGLEFEGSEKILVNLNDVFQDKETINEKIFVDWANGIYMVTHGKTVKDELDFERFNRTEYTLLRIKKGIIEESYTIPSDFNFNDVPEDVEEQLKILIEDYIKQKN